jgi:hypothetical protein
MVLLYELRAKTRYCSRCATLVASTSTNGWSCRIGYRTPNAKQQSMIGVIPNNIEIVFNWVKLRVRIQVCMFMRYILDTYENSYLLPSYTLPKNSLTFSLAAESRSFSHRFSTPAGYLACADYSRFKSLYRGRD